MTFGKRVRQLRHAQGWSLRDLAGKVGVGFTYLSRVENERLNFGDYPSDALIHRLADALDADAPSMWPSMGPITSGFGQREDPVLGNGEGEFHTGVDISAPNGVPIRATADGTVKVAEMENGYGREVIIDDEGELALGMPAFDHTVRLRGVMPVIASLHGD